MAIATEMGGMVFEYNKNGKTTSETLGVSKKEFTRVASEAADIIKTLVDKKMDGKLKAEMIRFIADKCKGKSPDEMALLMYGALDCLRYFIQGNRA